jgi:hypothetical protein
MLSPMLHSNFQPDGSKAFKVPQNSLKDTKQEVKSKFHPSIKSIISIHRIPKPIHLRHIPLSIHLSATSNCTKKKEKFHNEVRKAENVPKKHRTDNTNKSIQAHKCRHLRTLI